MAAFRKAADAGILIVPATGRHLGGVPTELQSVEVRYVIAVNGAEIYDLLEEHVLRRAEIAERNMPVQKVEMFFQNKNLRETELSRAKEYFF